MPKIVSSVIVPFFRRCKIPVKRFGGINPYTVSSAEADADGELGLYDSFIGRLELKFKTLFEILTYSLTISMGLAKGVHRILITMAGRSLQPFNGQSAIFSHTPARHIENAHVVFGVWFSLFGRPKVALKSTTTICPCT
jgi:hypothetical protein